MAPHARLRAEYDPTVSLRAELKQARAELVNRQKQLASATRSVAAMLATIQAIERRLAGEVKKRRKPQSCQP